MLKQFTFTDQLAIQLTQLQKTVIVERMMALE
jgi:hypothetical protein